MSGPGIEPQSWGGKTLAVVEISTDYYFGGGPHLNAKKKVHSSLQSQKKPFEATSHESQRQWCEGQVFIWRGLWKKRWSKKCGHKDGMEVVSCRWIDMHHFFREVVKVIEWWRVAIERVIARKRAQKVRMTDVDGWSRRRRRGNGEREGWVMEQEEWVMKKKSRVRDPKI